MSAFESLDAGLKTIGKTYGGKSQRSRMTLEMPGFGKRNSAGVSISDHGFDPAYASHIEHEMEDTRKHLIFG